MKGEVRLLKSVRLLVIEDAPSDVRLMREALRGSLLRLNITVATDGVEATKVLNEMKLSRSLPDVIVLDLNLPRKNGREVLSELKADPLLKHIPVLVLTSSHDEDDISAAYALNANCYIRKPMNLPDYERVMRSIEDFWFMTATLPQHNSLASVASVGGAAAAGSGKVRAQ